MTDNIPRFDPWQLQHHRLSFEKPVWMAIINVTPDSFYDGGAHFDPERAVLFALQSVAAGATILDVGGESSRPGSQPVSAKEEIRRILPVIHELAERDMMVSVDTTKAVVADAALNAGACIINDISGGMLDPEIIDVAADHGAAMVLQHMRGTPATMQTNIHFTDVVAEVCAELVERKERAVARGVDERHILVDPGIGFGKTMEQNLQLLASGHIIAKACNAPVLMGPSNKSFIGHLTGAPVASRLGGTIGACLAAWRYGAHVLRVHDTTSLVQAFTVFSAIENMHSHLSTTH